MVCVGPTNVVTITPCGHLIVIKKIAVALCEQSFKVDPSLEIHNAQFSGGSQYARSDSINNFLIRNHQVQRKLQISQQCSLFKMNPYTAKKSVQRSLRNIIKVLHENFQL